MTYRNNDGAWNVQNAWYEDRIYIVNKNINRQEHLAKITIKLYELVV
jgi:hypothetical protein